MEAVLVEVIVFVSKYYSVMIMLNGCIMHSALRLQNCYHKVNFLCNSELAEKLVSQQTSVPKILGLFGWMYFRENNIMFI